MAHAWMDKVFGEVPDLPGPEAIDDDKRASWALWSAAVLLVLLVFRGGFPTLGSINPAWDYPPDGLVGKMYWVAWGVLTYLVIPTLIIVFVFKESPARYGLRVHFTKKMALLYLGAFAVMVPLVYLASLNPAFIQKYPMVRDLGGVPARIWAWELARSLRFVALEFFFRGFLLFSLEKRFGYHAIAIAVLPYGLIHFAKPFPEALGAIIAGGVLGLCALRSRSIAGGVLVHAGVAAGMDLASLWRQGVFD
jgi:membrane protease YdiL (CAAX protease family)